MALSAAELRGWSLFNDPAKGNCAACHVSTGVNGNPPLFTDNTYDVLGVPRNPDIQANANPAYHDLGLCGPVRGDLAGRSDLCGAFRVPTLRNVAMTAPYFHNGAIKTLTDAVRFYVRRDTHPEEWYPHRRQRRGAVQRPAARLPPQRGTPPKPPTTASPATRAQRSRDRRPGELPARPSRTASPPDAHRPHSPPEPFMKSTPICLALAALFFPGAPP